MRLTQCTNTLCPLAGGCKRMSQDRQDPHELFHPHELFQYRMSTRGVVCEYYIQKYKTVTTSGSGPIKNL